MTAWPRARRWRTAAALALLLLLLAAGALWKVSKALCFTLAGEVTCRVALDEPVVALSLDDGPTPAGVDSAVAALSAGGTHATFFLIGKYVDAAPALVGRIVASGNEAANHSYTHKWMIGRSAASYDEEIARTSAALRSAGAPPPRLFRPPFGKKLIGLPLAVRRHGLRMIMWDIEDPDADDPRAYANEVVRRAKPGSIILMHLMYSTNRSARTARMALPLVLAGLKTRGFRVVTVGELLARAEQTEARR